MFNGTVYAKDGEFTGKVTATSGVFNGTVKATDFQAPSGVSMLKNGKFSSDYLDLGNIQIDGTTGNITMTGDINMGDASKIYLGGITIDGFNNSINFSNVGSITWGKYEPNGVKNTVVTYATGTSGTTPPSSGWQSTVPSVAKGSYLWTKTTITYTDGTTSTSYAVGYHGQNGSTPSLPTYIKNTYIDSVEIRSPTIKANDYYIYPYDENDDDGTFNIFGMFDGTQYHMFQIAYYGGDPPSIRLHSPASGQIDLGSNQHGKVYFEGPLDFSGVSSINWGNNAPKAVFG